MFVWRYYKFTLNSAKAGNRGNRMKKWREVTGIFTILTILPLLCFNSSLSAQEDERYISLDEIRPEMEAYCLTVYSGTKIERFELKILSVVRDQRPGRDMILVLGMDERFQHSGPVHGCSGSPVFIDGRLAGALAAGWDGSLDSLYLVRPIKDMLETGSVESGAVQPDHPTGASFYDFTKPVNLSLYDQMSADFLEKRAAGSRMRLPLAMSFPADVCESYRDSMLKMGFIPFSIPGEVTADGQTEMKLEQGGTLAVVLCGGDISMSAVGTVTEIIGDQVYGFGHSFLGNGEVHLPMSAGVVHTVVASRESSFKFAQPGPVAGTLLFDQAASVRGTIGLEPKTIPLKLNIQRYNDPENRTYDCFLGIDRNYTSLVLRSVVGGAAQMQGELPFEHTVRYQGKIEIEGADPIIIDNLTSGQDVIPAATEFASAVGLLLTNPFDEVTIRSVEANVQIEHKDLAASIWGVDLSNTTVKPGQKITASVILKSRRSREVSVDIDLAVPENLPAGKYEIMILGSDQYQSFVAKLAPQRFRAVDVPTLESALKHLFTYRRDRLHAVMQIPAAGMVFRQHELANLPPTKMLLMQDSKRITSVEPYRDWIENSITIDRVVDGAVQIEINVEN